MKSIGLSLVVFFSLATPLLRAECKEVKAEEFAKVVRDKRHIVFFASWCKSCAEHFTDAYAKDSVFVTTYDEAATADQILKTYLGAKASEVPCVLDKDKRLDAIYKVKFLPFVADLKA